MDHHTPHAHLQQVLLSPDISSELSRNAISFLTFLITFLNKKKKKRVVYEENSFEIEENRTNEENITELEIILISE